MWNAISLVQDLNSCRRVHSYVDNHYTTGTSMFFPSARAGYDTRSIFKRCLTGLNLEFSLSETRWSTKAEEFSLSYYLPIAGGRIIGFIRFPRVSVLYEMQSAASRIWTRVTVSISNDDNHYTYLYSVVILLTCFAFMNQWFTMIF